MQGGLSSAELQAVSDGVAKAVDAKLEICTTAVPYADALAYLQSSGQPQARALEQALAGGVRVHIGCV